MVNWTNTETVPLMPLLRMLSKGRPGEVLGLPLADGRADAPQIIAYLKQLSIYYGRQPFIREFTVSLFPAYMANNDLDLMLKTITSFVRDRLVYVPDPEGTEYFISPIVLIQRIQQIGRAAGDCDDHVLLLNSMAVSVGFDVRVAGVHLNDPVLWDHVISQVFIHNRWLDIDACLKTGSIPDYAEKLVS